MGVTHRCWYSRAHRDVMEAAHEMAAVLARIEDEAHEGAEDIHAALHAYNAAIKRAADCRRKDGVDTDHA